MKNFNYKQSRKIIIQKTFLKKRIFKSCEILEKKQRAYKCLLFQTHYEFFICIPYRSEISHPFAFLFKKSQRSHRHKSGLDYTKIIIINKNEFIDNKDAIIDKDEYIETIKHIEKIKKDALTYVETYMRHIAKIKIMDLHKFKRQYGYSTLKYFHKELGLKT